MLKQEAVKGHYNNIVLLQLFYFAHKEKLKKPSLLRRSLVNFYEIRRELRWLKTVSSTFQDVDFDGSSLPLLISSCCNHGIKKLPNHW